ncbi:hypothetical protein ASPVEDRAFT_39466 [Aspergillus versicolor CBS 583.65]|uniref:Uncharacterized protein n=1 Tax=Aspergillus versicolor CBS 583.65 TaxID=1036611 RepID=A0A1L9PEX3_ASPVE|nr:uncharacterized protein ASPVEDRAFT_39466 [Aspergillus versicolor CBS 583.65]OJJ00084.1 hypothetical protein ASPVEDRAFT_39466 [Aspergillus versicolor CBS 583.65]
MVEHEAPIVSHGRGGLFCFWSDYTRSANTTDTASQPGQGNIGPDSNEYIDGGIVREGPIGDQGDGAYSAGATSAPHM